MVTTGDEPREARVRGFVLRWAAVGWSARAGVCLFGEMATLKQGARVTVVRVLDDRVLVLSEGGRGFWSWVDVDALEQPEGSQ